MRAELMLGLAVVGTMSWGAEPKSPPRPVPAVQPTPGRAEAMSKLKFMRGVWAGRATGTQRDGTSYAVTQVERMGPMLGGDIIVIEGRGYRDDRSTGFNAFAVVSWDAQAQKFELRSYAQGYSGTFDLTLTPDGYVWEVPAGPGAVLRYTATIKDNHWREVGDYVAQGKPPVRNFEMNLTRVGDTDWPLGTPVAPEVGH
jgi:hypothetical protein